jgi:hypothetical protein
MVKKLKTDDFFSELNQFFNQSKNKYSIYLTFKRLYEEKFKYKKNKKNRKLRMEDRKEQDKNKKTFNVLIRAKLNKKRIHTIITPENLDSFHHNIMNVLTLHFIREEKKKKVRRELAKKKISKTQKRKIKKLKKIKINETKEINKKN